MAKSRQKLLFLDSNIFISCVLEQTQGSNINVLKDLLDKLKSNKTILILPEVVRREVEVNTVDIIFTSEESINKDLEQIKTGNNSYVFESIINNAVKTVQIDLKKSKTEILKIIKEIFENNNTLTIKLTDEILISGLKRASLLKAPFTHSKGLVKKKNKNNKPGEPPKYRKDQDCIIFESILSFLRKNTQKYKNNVLVFCTEDPDYYKNDKVADLEDDIVSDLSIAHKKFKNYRNSVEMFKKEFAEKYNKKDVQKYNEIKRFNNLTSRPVSVVHTHAGSASNYSSIPTSLVAHSNSLMNNGSASHSHTISGASASGLNSIHLYPTPVFLQPGETDCPRCHNNISGIIPTLSKDITYLGTIDITCPFCGTHIFVITE